MATNDENHVDIADVCCIEASVVSGFEECARGEAKEKFNTLDVKASRGKITWKVPIDSVKDVVKMGSIDNCRVVILSVPHFGFTNQHESLARLQQLILDCNWEQGLRVWNQFNEFSHPIPPKPDVIPSPEDLIDVVLVKARENLPKTGGKKKNKKGGKWKKERRGGKSSQDQEKEDTAPTSEENQTEDLTTSSSKGDKELESETVITDSHSNRERKITVDDNGTTKVVIKQTDPKEPPPEIEIKVLIPGPNENMFPIDIDNINDQRDLEPMDIDQSILQAPEDSEGHSHEKKVADEKSADSKGKEFLEPKSESSTSPVKNSSPAINILSTAKDFASSVIERLTTSPPMSIPNEFPSSVPSCATPPSTPVHQNLEAFMKSQANTNIPSTSVDVVNGSSVDNTVRPNTTSAQTFSSSVDDKTLLLGNPESSSSENRTQENSTPVTEDSTKSSTKTDTSPSKPTKKERDPTKPTFRVTCNRVGDGHSFDSASAAASLGSAIIRYFGWSVDLKNFDIEVLLNIENEEVIVSLRITKTSLHNRNLVAFGPTTLRATICYNMLRLCRVRNGDFVCDPMCGTSAIPIEGSLNWVNNFFFGGDYHDMGIYRSRQNIDALRQKQQEEKRGTMKIDTVQWNIEHFPLRDKTVDVFVSDLPFGYRMGSRYTNRTLYPTLLSAMARTARPGARACLLTEDKTSLIKALQTVGKLWQRRLILSINMGGLSGFVFLITRTTASYCAPSQNWKEDKTSSTTGNVDEEIGTMDAPKQDGEDVGRVVENVEISQNVESEKCTTAQSEGEGKVEVGN